eukprot:3230297-Ditylum_brightwellii.AAC.1
MFPRVVVPSVFLLGMVVKEKMLIKLGIIVVLVGGRRCCKFMRVAVIVMMMRRNSNLGFKDHAMVLAP